MISACFAPSDLRMPISCVRSVTLTSMMFMITIPPTTSEMRVTGTTTAEIMLSIWSMNERIASGVRVSNRSGWPGRAWNRVRSATREISRASSSDSPVPGRARPKIAIDWLVPYRRVKTVYGM